MSADYFYLESLRRCIKLGGQHHHHDFDSNHFDKKRVSLAFFIAFAVFFLETVIGYIVSGSLSLASDGLHVFSHIFIYGCVLWTLGNPKAETKSAFLIGTALITISVFILIVAVYRLGNPREVQAIRMFVIACIGLLANIIQIGILYPTNRDNLSLKGFFWHMLVDTGMSVIVVCAGIVLYFTNWNRIDTVLTFFFSPVVFVGGIKLIKDALKK